MVVLHPSRVDNKTFHLNLADDKTVQSKIKILKKGPETPEREDPKIRFIFKPKISAVELSYGDSNNVVITKPTTRTLINIYADKEIASIFQMGNTTIDDFPYYSIRRANGTVIYVDPIRVRRYPEGWQIATEPEEEETADLATPVRPTQVVGDTKIVFHKDHAEIIHDESKHVPPRTETKVELVEASKRMKAYVISKLRETGKDIIGEISALAEKTAKEKAILGKPKDQEEDVAKPKPQGLKFRNLEGKRSKKGKEAKSKETLTSSESEQTKTKLWN